MNRTGNINTRLSDIETGNTIVITKVSGHGAFRKRIIEMGFVKGKPVTVIKNAPLQDPIEYELMGYNVSLRRSEARLIEVISPGEVVDLAHASFEGVISGGPQKTSTGEKKKSIHVALVGNPNSGKTTLYNYASGSRARVANYGGVTIEAKEAKINYKGYIINIVDLPGTYSITEYTPEELLVRSHITENVPDVVINVVDASNLERNLFLTTQLIDMNIKVVIALNMYDEFQKKGAKLNYDELARMIGIPIIPTVAVKGKGIDDLIRKIIDVYEDKDPVVRYIHINYGVNIEEAVSKIQAGIEDNKEIKNRYSDRYLAVKLLENDRTTISLLKNCMNFGKITGISQREIARLEKEYGEKSETIVTDAKYGFIAGALKETYIENKEQTRSASKEIDNFITHKILGFPIFIFFMWLMFQATFTLGGYPMGWIDAGVGFIGKSFIPLLMGFGCNVPAVMATRTLENRKVRILTMLITPFMSCSARLPVYVLLISAFFPKNQGLVLFSIYFAGIILAILSALLLRKILFRKQDVPFVMELPPYRIPSLKNTSIHMWNKAVQYLKKMGSVILLASIFIWALSYYPRNVKFSADYDTMTEQIKSDPVLSNVAKSERTAELELIKEAERQEKSFIGQMGHFIEPVIQPLGFDWKIGVSIITGLAAKEIVVSSMGILYQADLNADETSGSLINKLQQQQHTSGKLKGQKVFSRLVAFGFMLFVLIYFPCIAVIASIRKESGWRWAVFGMVYPTLIAWVVAFLTYQIGSLLV